MSVRLHLFGSPTLARGGASSVLPFERRSQLLVFLALRRAWIGRSELAALLWPELTDKLAYSNLRKTLFRLQAFPGAEGIELQGNAVRFEVETDVFDFESALRERRAADALPWYRGELLAGFDDGANEAWSSWLNFERGRLGVAWRNACLDRLDGAIDAAEGIALSARLLDADPLDEAALRAHMTWLASGGQAALARQAYRGFVARLEQELRLAPGAELKALHDALGSAPVAKGMGADDAPVAPADDGFVGRTVELRRIAALLALGECRLLCLLGPGGIGKTRLARRALPELAPRFDDGAVWVELEDATTPESFGSRLARELGQSPSTSGDPVGPAIEALRDRQLLLVLDNFEQLAEHAGVLERLLESCPRLKILVTSRVRLIVAGEWSLPLDGLPFPDPEDIARADAFDAVRLFVKAAQRVEPGLVPAAESAAIADICSLVDGLPLALELAAAWVRVLPCETIAAELRRGTELLQAVDAAHPPRHASIDVVFEHSWRRLSVVERKALARLSVFRGGFTAEAARVVTGALLPVLGALADKSLLRKDGARLHLHALVQQLAALRLGDGAARTSTQAAHAAYFHRWLAQRKPASEGGDREALQAIDADFENCRQAWQSAIAGGQAEALASSVATLVNHVEHRARFEEGLALVRQVVESPLAGSDTKLRSLMLGHAALLEFRLGRYAQAEASASEALAARPRGRDPETSYQATSVLAGCALTTGRPAEAGRAYQQALALAKAGGLMHETAATLENLALVSKRMGSYDEALQLSIEALAQHRRNGSSARVALCLSNLGSMYMVLQDDAAAEAHLREALTLSERHGLVSTRAFVLANLTELAIKANDNDTARAHAEAALEVARMTGIRSLAGWLDVQLARLAARRGELALARALLSAGAELAQTLGAQTLKAAVLLGLVEVLEAQGRGALARQVLSFAVDEPSLSTPDKDELRAERSRRASPASPDPAWPGIALNELLHRVVVETPLAYAPLIAALRGTP